MEIQPEFVCVTRYLCGDTDDDGGSSSAVRICFVLAEAHTFKQFFVQGICGNIFKSSFKNMNDFDLDIKTH